MCNRLALFALLASAASFGCDQAAPVSPDAGTTEEPTSPDTGAQPVDASAFVDAAPSDAAPPMDAALPDFGPPPIDTIPDWRALTAGVESIDSGGAQPSSLVVFGPQALAVILDEDSRPFVAASRVEAGRVVLFGHEGYLQRLDDQPADNGRLLENALTWAAGDRAPNATLDVLLDPGQDALADDLRRRGHTARFGGVSDLPADVWVTTTYPERDLRELRAMRAFIAQGGGLVVGGHAWWWSYSTGNEDAAHDYPGNQFLVPMGLMVTTQADVTAGLDAVPAEPPEACTNVRTAVDTLRRDRFDAPRLSRGERARCAASATAGIAALPLDITTLFEPVAMLSDEVGPVVPTEASPLEASQHPTERVVVAYQTKRALEAPVERVAPSAMADDFPGSVSAEALRGEAVVDIPAQYAGRPEAFAFSAPAAPRWWSTGLYAAPGEAVTVTIESGEPEGLSAQIGAHTDTLWSLETWQRAPALTRSQALRARDTRVASGFGGPVYVRQAVGAPSGPVRVRVAGGVPMRRFVAGQTDLAAWRAGAGTSASPWAELETARVIHLVPTAAIDAVPDPNAVAALWDRLVDAQATLSGLPVERTRPERFVFDRQISAGWMHSGYPIMAHLPSVPEVIDLQVMTRDGLWGPLHELGHNHQWIDWVLPGTEEGNVNLFSVYCSEQVLGIDRSAAHPALAPAERAARIDAFVAGGRSRADWSVWTALETDLQVQERFGWAPFTAVFTAYRALADAERPADADAAAQQWMVRLSQATGADLTDFYAAWGFEPTPETRAAVSDLAPWRDHPMAGR